jgi:hypothetical protein
MATIRLRPQNKFGQRFLTAQAFWEYAQDLQLIEPSSCEGWLAFLEQERLLVPVCRIRYPAEIMHKYAVAEYSRENDSLYAPLSLPIDTDPARFSAVQELEAQIQHWAIRYRPVGKTPQYHPLDDVQPSHAGFIERQVANCNGAIT